MKTQPTAPTRLFSLPNMMMIGSANCGHLPALLFRNDDTVEKLESTATVLGMFGEWDCFIEERRLFPGDSLAVYTDGITESFDDAGQEFGEERLIEALRRHRHLSSQAIIAAVVDEVQQPYFMRTPDPEFDRRL